MRYGVQHVARPPGRGGLARPGRQLGTARKLLDLALLAYLGLQVVVFGLLRSGVDTVDDSWLLCALSTWRRC